MGTKVMARKVGGSMMSEITQYGITWTFDQAYRCGQYVTGDYWVLDPGSGVTISSISPAPVYHATNGYNGSMINPDAGYNIAHAWDSRNTSQRTYYNATLGFAPPDTIVAGDSLVSTIGMQAGDFPYYDVGGEEQDGIDGFDGAAQKAAAVLTCVASVPSATAFRPSYAAGTKITKTTSQINWAPILANTLTPVSGQPSLATMLTYVQRPWITTSTGWSGDILRPLDNIANYGPFVCNQEGSAAWALCCDYTQAEKRPILYGLLQAGIDLYAVQQAGGVWIADGGEGSGMRFPVIFAGYIFDDAAMKAVPADNTYGETGQTFYVSQTDIDLRDYIQDDLGIAEWGLRHLESPSYDTRVWAAAYRLTNTGSWWYQMALAMRVWGIQSIWNHDAFFDYMDRYNVTEPFDSGDHHDPAWVGNLITTYWDTYA